MYYMAMDGGGIASPPNGIRLCDTAGVLIDNCVCAGDAAITIPGVPERIAPTSTAIAAALLNAMMVEAVNIIVELGGVAPVFVSANLDGGNDYNKQVNESHYDKFGW